MDAHSLPHPRVAVYSQSCSRVWPIGGPVCGIDSCALARRRRHERLALCYHPAYPDFDCKGLTINPDSSGLEAKGQPGRHTATQSPARARYNSQAPIGATMAASTRPLTLGEILDRTVQLYRRNFPLFAGISFPPSAIYVLVTGVWAIYITSQMPALRTGTPNAPPDMQAMLALGLFSMGSVPPMPTASAASGVSSASFSCKASLPWSSQPWPRPSFSSS